MSINTNKTMNAFQQIAIHKPSHRCPELLRFTLQDGTPVLLRPVKPDDRERIQNGMAALSHASR